MKRTLRPSLLILSLLVASPLLADYEDGVNAAFKGDFDLAYHEFTIAAESGLDLAQYNLGILYFTGQGVDEDHELAYQWTLAAAEQGHVAAQANLASLYFGGQGVEPDIEMAVQWYSSAAKAGHGNAAFIMTKMYQEGESVSQDLVLAHAWASVAIANENADAPALRETIEGELNAEQLGQARRLFARWQIE